MKKRIYFIGLCILLLVICSCSDDVIESSLFDSELDTETEQLLNEPDLDEEENDDETEENEPYPLEPPELDEEE